MWASPYFLGVWAAGTGPGAIVAWKEDEEMTKLTLGTHPFLLGFDQLERLVERTAKTENGYPPYNIEQQSENGFRITLAVAGFADEDLSITIEDRQLVVRGKQETGDDGRVFLHRGIASRQFQRTFLLAEGVSKLLGPVYPLLSSAVGTLGAFMTGSNTNSNVIFGMFQKQTAELAGLSVVVILGAQTTGGSIGSMLAPAKILVGCSTVGLAGREGPVLAITMKYGAIITAIIGLVALIVHFF